MTFLWLPSSWSQIHVDYWRPKAVLKHGGALCFLPEARETALGNKADFISSCLWGTERHRLHKCPPGPHPEIEPRALREAGGAQRQHPLLLLRASLIPLWAGPALMRLKQREQSWCRLQFFQWFSLILTLYLLEHRIQQTTSIASVQNKNTTN